MNHFLVIPAQAGIQLLLSLRAQPKLSWIPAFAGMTVVK
jgi:hypothetical protein